MFKYLLIILFFCSCESVQVVSSEAYKGKEIEYSPTDTGDVEGSYLVIKGNQLNTSLNVDKGFNRAKRFESLFLKLIAHYDFGRELTKADIKPFRGELSSIGAVFSDNEIKSFTMHSTENKNALETLKKEADKGANNNHVNKSKDAKIKELQDIIDSKVSDKANAIAEKFFYLGGVMFALSLFGSYLPSSFGADKAKGIGFTFFVCGGLLLLIGTTVDFLREFLETHGHWLLLVLLIPSIVFYLKYRYEKTKDDIEELDD